MKIKTRKATRMQTEFGYTLERTTVSFVTQRKKFAWESCMFLKPFCSLQNQLFQPYFSCKFESVYVLLYIPHIQEP